MCVCVCIHVRACVLPKTPCLLSTAVLGPSDSSCAVSLSLCLSRSLSHWLTNRLHRSLLLWRRQQALICVAWTLPTQRCSDLGRLNCCLASLASHKIGWGSKLTSRPTVRAHTSPCCWEFCRRKAASFGLSRRAVVYFAARKMLHICT